MARRRSDAAPIGPIVSEMPRVPWKLVVLVLMEALLACAGVYALGHIVKAYVRWGYPPWAHFAAGALFLSAAIFLPLRRTRWLGAILGGCVAAPAAMSCALHGDYSHAVQGLMIIALIVWLARDRPTAAAV